MKDQSPTRHAAAPSLLFDRGNRRFQITNESPEPVRPERRRHLRLRLVPQRDRTVQHLAPLRGQTNLARPKIHARLICYGAYE